MKLSSLRVSLCRNCLSKCVWRIVPLWVSREIWLTTCQWSSRNHSFTFQIVTDEVESKSGYPVVTTQRYVFISWHTDIIISFMKLTLTITLLTVTLCITPYQIQEMMRVPFFRIDVKPQEVTNGSLRSSVNGRTVLRVWEIECGTFGKKCYASLTGCMII